MTSNLLPPIIALNAWTFLIEGWMYATRIPAFQKANIAADNTQTRSQIDLKTPAPVRWKADNYSNLFEQPTQFYAVALTLALARAGKNNPVDAYLAWGYVGVRVLHSLVHCTTNRIMRRFGMYLVSSGIVAVMTGRAAMLLI